MAGDGESQIVLETDKSGHLVVSVLTQNHPSVGLKVFKNGIWFMNGPFRSFSQDQDAVNFLQDIQDGYFPSEIKGKYPDGGNIAKLVIFNFEDYHEHEFGSNTFKPFEGQGSKAISIPEWNQAASVQIKEIPKDDQDNLNSVYDPILKPQTTEAFLKQLPKHVIRDGNVIEVRKGIQDLLVPPEQQQSIVIKTVVDQASPPASTQTSKSPRRSTVAPADITTLKIKIPNTQQDMILKMYANQTIQELKNYLEPIVEPIRIEKQGVGWELRQAFQAKPFSMSQTLKECGLVPNARLHINFHQNHLI